MTPVALAAILLLLAGTFLDVPVAIVLAIVVLLVEAVRAVWARYGLRDVRYVRRLERDRTTWGEEIPLAIEVWNRKPLPLAWLRADDDVPAEVRVRERTLAVGDEGAAVLRNAWTLAPYERVTRHFHVGAVRRGAYELGPVRLAVGDLFAREAAVEERPPVDGFLVRPRSLPMPTLDRRDALGGTQHARAGLVEDPSRFAGIREYAPGDALRRVHARASARLARPVVKVFEPSREREVLIALDVQTEDGPAWELGVVPDEVEGLFVVAASIARSLAADGSSFGLAAAGYSGAESRFAAVPVAQSPGQLERVLDLLARLSTHPSATFERLLARIARTTRPGTTVVVVTARDSRSYLAGLRRLDQIGLRVLVVACGPRGAADAAVARRAGVRARSVRLDGPWQSATSVATTR